MRKVSELQNPETCFTLTTADFAALNPNTGTAPIFRSRRDAALTTAIYSRLPILVDRSSGSEVKAWPVKYIRMFDMTNVSGLFRSQEELEEKEGAFPVGKGVWQSSAETWVPLYQGRAVEAYDHRFAGVDFNPENLRRVTFLYSPKLRNTRTQATCRVFNISFRNQQCRRLNKIICFLIGVALPPPIREQWFRPLGCREACQPLPTNTLR